MLVSRAFSVLCVYSTFRHHPHPLGYLCAKFCFFHCLHCWASPWRKIAYSITHPAYLMPWNWSTCTLEQLMHTRKTAHNETQACFTYTSSMSCGQEIDQVDSPASAACTRRAQFRVSLYVLPPRSTIVAGLKVAVFWYYTVSRKKVTPCVLFYNSGKWCRILTKIYINSAALSCKQTAKFE